MGMFDYIRCEVPLPDGWTSDGLQTKDFDCELVTHVIRADGRLILERIDQTETVPKSERPYPDAADGSLKSMMGSVRQVTSHHDANYHGVIRFYNIEGDWNNGGAVWHEYNAKFTDGNLVEITVAPGCPCKMGEGSA